MRPWLRRKAWLMRSLHTATQAPQPMQAAASIDASAESFGTGIAFPSGAAPVLTEMNPPAGMILSRALRSVIRSLIMGKAFARHGSIKTVSASLKWRMWSWQVAVPQWPPCAIPLMTSEHIPQIPSRQSESKAIGSSPSAIMVSLTTSSISRKECPEEHPEPSKSRIGPARWHFFAATFSG